MQLQDIRTEVRTRAGVNANDTIATDAVLNSLINASIREMANARDWDFHQITTSLSLINGTSAYNLGGTYRKVLSLSISGYDGSLKPVTPVFASNYKEDVGFPRYWYMQSNSLHVLPTPNQNLQSSLTYLVSETELSGDTDEPLIPDYAIDWVVIKAALRLAARMDNTSMHRLLYAESRDVMEALVDDARRSGPAPSINYRTDWHV